MSNLGTNCQQEYTKIKRIFSGAISKDMDEIESFVAEVCKNNIKQMNAVMSLIKYTSIAVN